MFQWRKRMLANVERARIERLAKEIGRASRAWSLPALVRNYEGQPPPRWSTAPDRRYLPLRRAAGDPEQGKTDGHLHEADRPDCMTSRGAWRTGKPPVSKAGQRVARAGVHAGVGPPVSTLERTHSPAVTAGLAGRPSTSPGEVAAPRHVDRREVGGSSPLGHDATPPRRRAPAGAGQRGRPPRTARSRGLLTARARTGRPGRPGSDGQRRAASGGRMRRAGRGW